MHTKTYSERQFKETVAGQQFTLVSALADEIDGKIQTIQSVLAAAGRDINPAIIADRQKTAAFINSRTGTDSLSSAAMKPEKILSIHHQKDGLLLPTPPPRR